jgi:mono/diheme cytochrome c family protein
MTRLWGCLCAAALLLAALLPTQPGMAQQQHHHGMPGMDMPGDMTETKSAAPYHPGLGELMTAFVQPRHIKLGLAGAAQNWPLAAYELGELRETFEDVGKLVPKHGGLAMPSAIAATVTPSLTTLAAAVKAKDAAAFAKGYAELTTGCNACHQSADHPMIVIQAPTGAAVFPDQDFRPSQK